MKKAVILLSGGLDSTTCLAVAKDQGFHCHTLAFDYGQKHRVELKSALAVSAHFDVPCKIFELNIGQFGGSALTDENLTVPDYQGASQTIPITYVPARNTIFLSIALAWAEVLNARDIFIGVSAIDYSGYPDCRPEFIHAFQQMANLATKYGVEEGGVKIHTPLIHLSKAETIHLGMKLQVPYEKTVSCYRANDTGEACGECDSCKLRKNGFAEAFVADPTFYARG